MTDLVVKPEAHADAEGAAIWYEEQRDSLGGEFLQELDETFARITEHPRMYTDVFDGARRALMRRFPYAVYYVFENNVAQVLAILHLARDPDLWRSRLP